MKIVIIGGAILEKNTLTPDNPVFSGTIGYSEWIAKPENKR